MPENIDESLQRILDYLHDDQIKDWDDKDCPNDHIYIDIRRVMGWLGTQ